MSEDYFLFFEEVDWCFRAAARGWRRSVVPSASIAHLEGGTMADAPDRRTRASTTRSVCTWAGGMVVALLA